jgi:hypothetical protein
VNLDPDFDARVGRSLPALLERLADLRERLLFVGPLRDAVGPHLHAGAAEVVNQLHERLAVFDVLLHHLGLVRVELAHAAAPPEHDARVRELLLHLFALVGAEARFDTVLVRGAALDGRDPDLFAHLQNGGQVPVRGHVVGDEAEFELRCGFGGAQVRRGERGGTGGEKRAAGERVHGFAFDVSSWAHVMMRVRFATASEKIPRGGQ